MGQEKPKRLSIIAVHGTMDMAFPPLILASTAIAMDMEAAIFFTFYGLDIIKKNRNLQVAPLANPAMPKPFPWMPFGVPNIVGVLPGMTAMATMMMKSWVDKAGVMNTDKLLDVCVKGGVTMIGCQMTMDMMGVKKEDLIDGVVIGGAGTYLDYSCEADINLAF